MSVLSLSISVAFDKKNCKSQGKLVKSSGLTNWLFGSQVLVEPLDKTTVDGTVPHINWLIYFTRGILVLVGFGILEVEY